MFRFAGRGRRRLAIAGVSATGLIAGVAMQASASAGSAPRVPAVPVAQSLKQQAQALESKLTARAGPRASAVRGDSPVTVSCGQTITTSTTLTEDLHCSVGQLSSGFAVALGANGITLNLGDHTIFGPIGDNAIGSTGVETLGNADTVKNGYISGFELGVAVTAGTLWSPVCRSTTQPRGSTSTDQRRRAVPTTTRRRTTPLPRTRETGSLTRGATTRSSQTTLNNGRYGLVAQGFGGAKLLDNIADGNGRDGIVVVGSPQQTLTGNTGNFNGGLGINASSPQIDGGKNLAKGNADPQQCRGVVCS